MDAIRTALQNLLDFIESKYVQDRFANDGSGMIDVWRSGEFQKLIDEGKAAVAVQHETDHCDGILLVGKEVAA